MGSGTRQGGERTGPTRPAPAHARDQAFLRALVDRIDPLDATAHNNLGVLLASRGLLDEALDALLRALELDSRFRVAADNLALLDRGSEAVRGRIADLLERLRDEPGDHAARRTLARLLRLLGRGEEAVPHLDLLLARDGHDAALTFERALVEHTSGTKLRAQRWCERTLALEPTHALARLKLAEALYHQGRSDAALTVLLDAFARGEDSAEAHLLHSFVLGDLGSADDACQAAALAARRNPAVRRGESAMRLPEGFAAAPSREPSRQADAAVRLTIAVAFRERGYLEEGIAECERVLQEVEDDDLRDAAEQIICELLLVAGRVPDALARYEQRLIARAGDARLLAESGVALHQAGARDAADARYREALAIDDEDVTTWYNAGVLAAERGLDAASESAFARALTIDPSWSAPLAAQERLAFGDSAHTLPLSLAVFREWPEARLPERAPMPGMSDRVARTPHLAVARVRPTPIDVAAARAEGTPRADGLVDQLREAVLRADWAHAEALLSHTPPAAQTGAWRLLRARVLAHGDDERRLLAQREIRHLLADHPPLDAAALHFAGDVAAMVGDTSTALEAWRRALAWDPERPSARVAIARVLLEQGQRTAAMVEASAAVAVAPRIRAVAMGGSRVLHATGAVPTAVRTLARYLISAPDDLDALCALGAALLAMGQLDEARMLFARARAVRESADSVRTLGEAIARVEARRLASHLPDVSDRRPLAGATA
ncbi:MAG: APC3/CDC27 family protein [Gemmatimonadaceae bacterium]|nr:APC3/CDC27 family protein [Gemmatimonadaceae bacterium]